MRRESGHDAPAWITEPLIALTLKVWQPYYPQPLSREEAIAMIINVGQLYHVIARGQNHETVCGLGTRQQSGAGA